MRTLAIVNQKGGCGKTTTTVNLAGCLARDGARVLVLDMDPQAHATLALGVDPEIVDANLYEVLVDAKETGRLPSVIQSVGDRLDLAPSGIVMSALEQRLSLERSDERTLRLQHALASVADDYDYALIDCPPNVGILTFNALRAATEVIVPLEPSHFAIHGVEKLLETIALLTEKVDHSLTVRILTTLFDGRTRFGRETLAFIRERFGPLCYDTVIRQNVRLREAAKRGKPLIQFARTANGARDYAALAIEVAADGLTPEVAQETFEIPTDLTSERAVKVQFRDRDARDVRIAGDFNGWVPDKGVESRVQRDGEARVWTKVLNLPPGTYQYRYVVDGEWKEDPTNPRGIEGPIGGRISLLVVS